MSVNHRYMKLAAQKATPADKPPDVIQEDHVFDCHGLSLDRFPDPGLHFWWVFWNDRMIK